MLPASLGQSPHGVPGWQDNGLLLHHGQDLLGHVLLVHHHLVHVLGEPVIGHDQVTWGRKQHHSTETLQGSSHRQASARNDALNRAWPRWLFLKTHQKISRGSSHTGCTSCAMKGQARRPPGKTRARISIIYVCSVKMGIENTQGNYKAFKAECKII